LEVTGSTAKENHDFLKKVCGIFPDLYILEVTDTIAKKNRNSLKILRNFPRMTYFGSNWLRS
jgi:hypothetical protein